MDDQRDIAEEQYNQHILDTGDGEIDVHTDQDGEKYVLVHDAIGQGMNVAIYRNRGIVSIVLEDDTGRRRYPSAEVQIEDIEAALSYLTKEA